MPSTPTRSTQIRLARRPQGAPTDDDFETTVVDLPDLGEGQVLLRVLYLSLDPYMRSRMNDAESYAAPVALGAVMVGGTVCEVIESRSPRRAVGDIVVSSTGWQTHGVAQAAHTRRLEVGAVPVSTALGVLGMPGFTAYAGLLQIGRPQPGETVVVAAATGPVGSAVGQIARARGARAVGIAGGPDKCRALVEEFGFDAAVDHHRPTFAAELREACPEGIDVYFENVGGAVGEAAFGLLNDYARVPLCGLVAEYNATGADAAGSDRLPAFMSGVLTRSLTVRGFLQDEFLAEHEGDFRREMAAWVADGTVRYREDVVEGLEQAPAAFAGLLTGRNFGKLVIRVGAEQALR